MKEFARSWPIIGISLVMWLAVVILRTPALGIDAPRVVSILVSSTAMLTLGVYVERIRRARDEEKKQ
ncbi:hypothetical protein MYRNA_124 [Mycobacterium phage Myrna]|uniref:Uncharacterized protein n=1 Tax=Mycobacterium phage Myrna TaxID=546805 RepID=B5LJC8_9CAUD|nr:123 [Mycobacterium phage Myrna]ACH62125.1 hypothetical protein MYRNA_124 [Mycobacterium phage Myrna]